MFECDHEASIIRKPWPNGAYWVVEKNKKNHDDSDDFGFIYRNYISESVISIN